MRRRFALGTLLGVLSQLSAIGLLLASGWLISRAAQQPPVLYLMVAIVGVRAFGIARAALRYAERLVTHDAALRRLAAERIALYGALRRSAPRGLPAHRRGDVLRRILDDVDALQDRIVRVRQPWIETVASCVVTIAVVTAIDPRIGALHAVAVAGAIVLSIAVVGRASRSHAIAVVPAHGQLAADAIETMSVAAELIANGRTQAAAARLKVSTRRLAAAEQTTSWLAGLGSALVAVCIAMAVTGSVVVGVAAVHEGSMDAVLLAVVVLAPLALWEQLEQLSVVEQNRHRTTAAVARVRALNGATASVSEPEVPCRRPDRWDLSIRDLDIGWGRTPVARGISFRLPEGGVVAVTGPSGSGKSTLGATVARLIEPLGGSIELGGTDVRELASADVRSRIGMLEQEGHAFDTTIRENLRIGRPDADEEAMRRALNMAGLTGFLAGLIDGLDTQIGPGGDRLSGGERQRLALARALVADRRILILDEPTEFLDAETAEALLTDLLALAGERSLLVFTHSPAVLERIGTVVDLGGAPATIGA